MKGCVALVAVLLAGAPAGAQPAASDHRYEVTLLSGASLLSAQSDRDEPFPEDTGLPFEEFLPGGVIRRLLPDTIRTHDRIGGSFLMGFEVSRRLARRGWVEARFAIAPAHTRRRRASFRCPGDVCAFTGLVDLQDALTTEERVVAYHYGLGFAYELARGEVRPYLSVGAGAVTYDAPRHAGGTSFAFDVGAGARMSLGERLGARLEVVDRILPDHFLSRRAEHDVQVRAGLSFRLP